AGDARRLEHIPSTALVTPTNKQDQRLAVLPVVNAMTGTVGDSQLADAVAYASPVANRPTLSRSIRVGDHAPASSSNRRTYASYRKRRCRACPVISRITPSETSRCTI